MRSPVPKYFTIKAVLQAWLEREYSTGARLPSELILCRDFGVSRVTIQHALDLLEKEGWIRREQGRGTFYAGPAAPRTETRPSELGESIMRSRAGAYRVLAKGIVPASLRIAERLRIKPGEPIVALDRIGFVDDQPIVVVRGYLLRKFGEPLLNAEAPLEHTTLGSLLQDEYGVPIDSVLQTIGASLADPTFADHLDIAVGSPVLEGERIYFDAGSQPIMMTVTFYRTDRHRFVMTLKPWR